VPSERAGDPDQICSASEFIDSFQKVSQLSLIVQSQSRSGASEAIFFISTWTGHTSRSKGPDEGE